MWGVARRPRAKQGDKIHKHLGDCNFANFFLCAPLYQIRGVLITFIVTKDNRSFVLVFNNSQQVVTILSSKGASKTIKKPSYKNY